MIPIVPPDFHGVWRRVALSVDANAIKDDSKCFWAQGPRRFADVRISRADPKATTIFAGTTVSTPGAFTWHHDFSSGLDQSHRATPFDDTAAVDLDGDQLVERGTINFDGQILSYEEVWQRVTVRGDVTATSVVERHDQVVAVAVTTGMWMVVAHVRNGHFGGWVLQSSPPGRSAIKSWMVSLGTSGTPLPLPGQRSHPEWPWRRD